MQCPQCGTENPARAKYCLECGSRLGHTCPQCGLALPFQARSCGACGAQLPPIPSVAPGALVDRLQRLVPAEYAERLLATRGQMSPERRTVTILFSDVKGSTAMAEALDPEDVLEIMDGAFDVLIEPVYRYEGTLARLMGDAVLAFFGAPIAHEDDPERACRAALEIIAGAQRYAGALERERGITGFNVRVGIHTGLVVVGEVGSDLRVEYTAMGDAINLAARMESAAEPGTVLITGATQRLIAPLFETEALGPVPVKGKAEPVAVYRVLAAREAPGKVRGIAGLESPLVGREGERAALGEALERLQAGVGGIVTIVGEAGIGKSRLVAELQSGASHLTWVEGRCLSYGTSIAYLLWLDVLRDLLGVTLDDAPAQVEGVLRAQVETLCPERDAVYPYLARLLSLPLEEKVEERLGDLDGRTLRDRTFAAVETLLACTAQEQPLVVVCEDLHWADPTSLQLLEGMFALSGRLPLLFVCIFRPVREHLVWQLRERLSGDGLHAHTDVWLEPLSAADSQEVVTNLLWVEDLPPALKARILSRAEGNPFYLEEILRSLIDQAAIIQDPASGRWQAMADVERIAIPDTLEGVLVARIDRLQEETRRVLQLASVIGRIFLYRILAEIAAAEAAAYEELALDRRLETLQREELIRERARLPELEYIFKHDLTREAAYNGLLKRDRRIYHRQVAEALERLFPDRAEEQVGLLAHHWERAGDAEKAVEYLQQAGDGARLAYSHAEAVEYYQRALRILKETEEYERAARTLMKLGLTYHNAFDFRRSRDAYEEGFTLWQRAGLAEPATALPPAPHALRVIEGSPRTLDPTMAGDGNSARVIVHLFSGLLELTTELSVVPGVARSWQVSDGGRRYTFRLREDVAWSDGVPVTAHDFAYAWQRVLDPACESPNASLLYDVVGARAYHQGQGGWADVGIEAVDSRTLAVELEAPTGYFLQLMAHGVTYPVPRHLVEACGEAWTEPDKIVTNGPFRLASWVPGESLVLTRCPRYHGRRQGNLRRVELCLLSVEQRLATALALYARDGLDVLHLNLLSTKHFERARHRHDCITTPSLVICYLAFHPQRSPFDDPRVRRALVLATDRQWLTNVPWKGQWSAPTGGFVPPGMPGHSPGIALPYDPERARGLLAEAGYPGGQGFPALRALGIHGWEPNMEALAGHWRTSLGIEVDWECMDWATYVDQLDRNLHHIYLALWSADYPDPDNFLRVAVQRFARRWGNRAYDGLVERARRLTDQAERMELYGQADRMLVQEALILPLAYWREHTLVKPWVRRYPTSPARVHFWHDVVIEPH